MAFGFGSGFAAKAPGTIGTLAAIPVYLLFDEVSAEIYLGILLLGTLIGIWACNITSNDLGVHDFGGIVWDEWIGIWITLFLLPPTWEWILLGFILFRLFDIWKPWPISWFDKNLVGGVGIMLDDIVAGLMAWLCLYVIYITDLLYL